MRETWEQILLIIKKNRYLYREMRSKSTYREARIPSVFEDVVRVTIFLAAIPVIIGVLVAFFDNPYEALSVLDPPTSGPLSNFYVYAACVIYAIVRLAILAAKILIPYLVIRFLVNRFDWSEKLYYILIIIGLAALITDGSSYRKYRKENPDAVKEWNKMIDDDAPIAGKIIHYEACRMLYDIEKLTD